MNSDTLQIIYKFLPIKDKITHLKTSKLFNSTFYNDSTISIMREATNKSKITDENRKHILLQICKNDDENTLQYLYDQKLIFADNKTLKQILIFSAVCNSVKIINFHFNSNRAVVPRNSNYKVNLIKPYFYFFVLLLHKKRYDLFNKIITNYSISANNLVNIVLEVGIELDDSDMINYFFSTHKSIILDIHSYSFSNTLKYCCYNNKQKILTTFRNNKLVTDQRILSSAISANNLSVAKWIYNFGNCAIDINFVNTHRNTPIIIFTWMLSKCDNVLSSWNYDFIINTLTKYTPFTITIVYAILRKYNSAFKYGTYSTALLFVGTEMYDTYLCQPKGNGKFYLEIKNLMDYCNK